MPRLLSAIVLLAAVAAQAAQPPADRSVALTPAQRIDQLIDDQLDANQIPPNPRIDDATFLRRVYLDLIGRIPTIEESDKFFGDSEADSRSRIIDHLLQSEGYVSHFYHFWADILRINSRLGINETPAAVEYAYRLWLKQALRKNLPYDALVRKLVSARGHYWENGAAGYYHRDRGMPLDHMANTARIFLGTRLECAQCHDHPYDPWTQLDFYRMAAFSFGMESKGHTHPNRKALLTHLDQEASKAYTAATGVKDFPRFDRAADLKVLQREKQQSGHWQQLLAKLGLDEDKFVAAADRGIVALKTFEKRARRIRGAEANLHIRVRYVTTREYERVLQLPHDYQYDDAQPFDEVTGKTLFGGKIGPIGPDHSTIEAYAEWLTSRENPTFTRVIANRLWSQLFGSGVFESLDNLTPGTKASNPELMDYLEDLMRDLDYDMKAFLAVVCKTRSYQRAATDTELEPGEPYHFQGPLLRRMSAEQIWDSIAGMVLPEADHFRPKLVRQLQAIDRYRLIYEGLSGVSEDEYIGTMKALAKTSERISSALARVYNERTQARVDGNAALADKIAQAEKALRNELGQEISRIQKSLQPESDEEDVLTRFGVESLTVLPKPKYPKSPPGLDLKQLKAWRARTRVEYLEFVKAGPSWARAAELDSPAPRGHFLRDFGQSDRDMIENASEQASIPQAFNLLNGPAVDLLTNRFTGLGRRLHAAESPQEKAVLIFRALLTRRPKPEEMKLIRAELERAVDGSSERLAWALLNTQQFLFVQ
ncbi:MAG: DUF1549 domain-containing protein [Verrucomicrobiia bacterium]|jgi:hypothetical protein